MHVLERMALRSLDVYFNVLQADKQKQHCSVVPNIGSNLDHISTVYIVDDPLAAKRRLTLSENCEQLSGLIARAGKRAQATHTHTHTHSFSLT